MIERVTALLLRHGVDQTVMERLKRLLMRVGLDGVARRLWRRRIGRPKFAMARPPFEPAIQNLVSASPDPVRSSMIALAVMSLQREAIQGAFAEVGVYRGETSRLLHTLAPGRKLYLFDTFAGFPRRDLEQRSDERFKDTTIQVVRAALGDLTGVEIRQGYFPDTARGLEAERFAFVLIDVDLFKPTLAALEFFYPRTIAGGYIIVDDYNSGESERGVSRAFGEFLGDKPERLVEMPDAWGSVVLRKQ